MSSAAPDPHETARIPWNELPAGLRAAAEPIRQFLEDPEIVEIMCNRPGEIFIEKREVERIQRFEVPKLDRDAIERLAHRIAAYSNQHVNAEAPLLSAAMPNGERYQAVLWPTSPSGGAFSIRKQVIADMTLEDYFERGGFDRVRITGPKQVQQETITLIDRELLDILRNDTPKGRLEAVRFAFQNRCTSIISGGTSSGKTTLFNAGMKEIPEWERFATIEDTAELKPIQPNWLQMIASKGDQGVAKVTVQNCLEAVLRMRPDRLFLGEIRGAEAFTFLQAVNTGHPGSSATLHADNPWGAYERVAMAALQANLNMSKAELIEFARMVVPIVFQIGRDPTGRRAMIEIYFSKWDRASEMRAAS